MKKDTRILNGDIKANKVQLITDGGENLWEMSLKEARSIAYEKWLDLMLMWRNADLTIIKMLDYWKFLYREKKKEQKNKLIWKNPDLKTIRITFKIWDHDLEIKKKQALKFAEWWHPLKVSLMLRWRENHYASLAFEKMEHFVSLLEEVYKIEWKIRKNWNNFIAILKVIK
jgi:translation initiation factor IF-3